MTHPFRSLVELGFDETFQHAFAMHRASDLVPARVVVEHRGAYLVSTERGDLDAELAGKLRHDTTARAALPAVGDWVVVRPDTHGTVARIVDVLPRRTQFLRGTAGRREEAQVVAANVDVVFLVCALAGDVSLRRLERTLALALASGAAPVVVLTKVDLAQDLARVLDAVLAVARRWPIHVTSGLRGDGVAELRPYFDGHRTVALLGASGAGKSTLVNALVGESAAATSEVAIDGRGRHTTTRRHLLPVPGGGLVLDTPGMRELRVWDADVGIDEAFDEVESLAQACRFRDCAHDAQPGCAVRRAMDEGELSPERVDSYEKLKREAQANAIRRDARAAAEVRRNLKVLSRAMRAKARERR